MSDETPDSTTHTPRSTPEPDVLGSADPAPESAAEPAAAEPVETETAGVEPVETETAVVEPAVVEPVETPVSDPVHFGQQVVYVQTPAPPRAHGNRVVGVLLALLGAVVFAAIYAGAAGLILYFRSSELFGSAFNDFLGTAFFWVPILVFALGFVLLVVIVNRGGWPAHVFASLLLAFVVYFASIGLLLLVGNVFRTADEPVSFASLAINPLVIASAIVAREVAIWVGLAIAARGRRVKARNVEARAAFERELAEKKAEYERPAAATA